MCSFQLFPLRVHTDFTHCRGVFLAHLHYESLCFAVINCLSRGNDEFHRAFRRRPPFSIGLRFVKGSVSTFENTLFGNDALMPLQDISVWGGHFLQLIDTGRKRCGRIHIAGSILLHLPGRIRLCIGSKLRALAVLHYQIAILLLIGLLLGRAPFRCVIREPFSLRIMDHVGRTRLLHRLSRDTVVFFYPYQGIDRTVLKNHQIRKLPSPSVSLDRSVPIVTRYLHHKGPGSNPVLRNCCLHNQITAIGQGRRRHHTATVAEQLTCQILVRALCLIDISLSIVQFLNQLSSLHFRTVRLREDLCRAKSAHGTVIQCLPVPKIIYDCLHHLHVGKIRISSICEF